MLLNDIGKSPTGTFNKVNRHLMANYGFKISEDASDKDLVMIMEQIEEEITDLKIKGDDSKSSPEISQRLLVLEAIKSLRESALLQMQSPKLETVIAGLADYVVDTFHLSGMCDDDYNNAVNKAMEEYRSSRYRFPDDYIEQRIREASLSKLREPAMDTVDEEMVDEGPWDDHGKRAGRLGGYEMAAKDETALDNIYAAYPEIAGLSMEPEPEQELPMIIDKHGRKVVDPFAKQKADRLKGIVMKENTIVKKLRHLLETEVSQAEVMMASKGFAQELQEMIEKIGRLQNEDLPPVTDQMRETYGTDSASAFQTQIYGALQTVMNSLYTAKSQVDDAVSNMAETGSYTAGVDMEKDIGDDLSGANPDLTGMDADLDNIAADEIDPALDAEMDADLEDEFGGAEGEEPLGRAIKKESVEKLEQKVLEMKRIVEKARKLRESRK